MGNVQKGVRLKAETEYMIIASQKDRIDPQYRICERYHQLNYFHYYKSIDMADSQPTRVGKSARNRNSKHCH